MFPSLISKYPGGTNRISVLFCWQVLMWQMAEISLIGSVAALTQGIVYLSHASRSFETRASPQSEADMFNAVLITATWFSQKINVQLEQLQSSSYFECK